jgi:hypothetical protein
MRETLCAKDSHTLTDLWRRRYQLSSPEIGQMYDLIQRGLRNCNPPELQMLGESRQELIAQFIYSKVLRLHTRNAEKEKQLETIEEIEDDGHSAPSSSYALYAYFRRYLIDCTRASSFKRRVAVDEEVTDFLFGEEQDGDEVLESLVEYGLSVDRVVEAARRFISDLGEPERTLLCESFGQEARGGLSGIASRHAITSYHYRAGRLGLVHKRQGLTADYSKTQLGQWIEKTLGVPIHAENMQVILSIFKILGAQASYA